MFSTSLVRSFLLSLIFLAPSVAVAKHHDLELAERIIQLEKELHDCKSHRSYTDSVKEFPKTNTFFAVVILAAGVGIGNALFGK